MNEEKIRALFDDDSVFLVIEPVAIEMATIMQNSPFVIRERYISEDRPIYHMIFYNTYEYKSHGFVRYEDLAGCPKLKKSPFYGKDIDEPVRMIMKAYANLYKRTASEYEDFYVFGGPEDVPNPSDRDMIAAIRPEERVFEYLAGKHKEMERDVIRFCCHLIALAVRIDKKLSHIDYFMRMEQCFIYERTEDVEARTLHISNLKKWVAIPYTKVPEGMIVSISERILSLMVMPSDEPSQTKTPHQTS